jgi:hypothetical protein
MIKKTNSDKVIFVFDLPRKEVQEKILLPFTKQEVFRCDSSVIRHSEIDEFAILETEISYSEIHKKTKARRISEKLLGSSYDEKEIYSIDEREIIKSGKDVTEDLIRELNIQEQESPKIVQTLTHFPNQVYDKGQMYEFYKDIKQISSNASTEVFLVDSYVDEEVLDLYIANLPRIISVRILTNKPQGNFLAVAKKFKLKPNAKFEVRQNSDCHDRLLFVDDVCWVMGQSIKDAAKKPTYLIRIDAYEGFKRVFEDLWAVSKIIV